MAEETATNNDGRKDNNVELTKEVVENSMVVQYKHVRRKLQEIRRLNQALQGQVRILRVYSAEGTKVEKILRVWKGKAVNVNDMKAYSSPTYS
jgi:hypothetical protein